MEHWVGLAVILLFWGIYFLYLRSRGASARVQMTVGLLGVAVVAVNLLFELGMLRSLRAPRAWEVGIWLLVLGVAGWGFYRRGMVSAYVFLAVGISLVCVSMLLDPRTESAVVYPLQGIGIGLMIVSSFLMLRHKRGTQDKGAP